MPRLRHAPRLLLSLLLLSTTARAVIIDNFTSATNDRFANDPSFVGGAFDWSGVGRGSSGQWATLVADNVFISANHLHPSVGTSLTFYASNDSSGPSATVTVSSGQRIGSSDLWIGLLSSRLSPIYATYDYLTGDITNSADFAASAVVNTIAKVTGLSPSAWSSTLDVAVGENVIDLWATDVSAGGTTDDSLVSLYQTGVNDRIYETLLQGGDSGAPLFLTAGSTLYLAGINWWEGQVTIGNAVYNASGYSYLGNYDETISAFISAHSISAVPEPATWTALAGILAAFAAIGTRRRAPVD